MMQYGNPCGAAMSDVDGFGLYEIILIAVAVIIAMLLARIFAHRRRHQGRRRRTRPAQVERHSDPL